LLARPSTPPEVIEEALSAPTPPKVEDIRRKIKAAKAAPAMNTPSQIPEIPGFEQPGLSVMAGHELSSALDLLHEVADTLAHLERSAHELPANAQTDMVLERAERLLAAIRRALRRH